ncbi:hypothetical protein Glove_81g46 [Diversispora epigaea]|uniref:Uncharacterized protein n=1 Tax=Diversispora epigaea TaxID=1348612 RepID=A0A397JCD9_9GLOM|nr:hypothetical protein Glove_81g46 [Diversispora epigaea]
MDGKSPFNIKEHVMAVAAGAGGGSTYATNAIGQCAPLFTPWWAQVNWYFGVILGTWIINVLDAQKWKFLLRHPT